MTVAVAVFGASGCGRGVMPLVREQFSDAPNGNLVFVDDGLAGGSVNGSRICSLRDFSTMPADRHRIVVAIANGRIRSEIVARCADAGLEFFEARASSVVQMDAVEIGEGAILSPFVTLTSNIVIGRHFHANLYSYVEHDCIIGDYVTFAPRVSCNGNVHIGDYAYIGTNACLIQGKDGKPLTIGEGAVVGMGSVVTKPVAPYTVVVGNPARPIRKISPPT